MAKVIKEIIIMLLVCLISMLVFAVVLYKYVPNRKVVAEVSTYTTSEEISTQLADNIDSEEQNVVLTYEVTAKDLNSYEVTNEYVPGKANPFAAYSEEVEQTTDGNTVSGSENNTTGNTGTSSSDNNTTETNSLFRDEGIK